MLAVKLGSSVGSTYNPRPAANQPIPSCDAAACHTSSLKYPVVCTCYFYVLRGGIVND